MNKSAKHPWLDLLKLALLATATTACQAMPQRLDTKTIGDSGAVAPDDTSRVNLESWPVLNPPPLDPAVEARVDAILAKMTIEQKVGQVVQGDSESVTPEDVKRYRLGSVLSGGNSAPGDLPFADTAAWLASADAYFEASIDPEGVEVVIPIIWGIDAVHGHANLVGATVFPHNIGLGAARDPDLIEDIMVVTAAELIVSGHDWTFAPTLAVPRDDRWGRTYEGFSEDPDIVAAYADRIVYGLQGRPGTDEFFADGRVISSAKHYTGDGGTTNGVDQGDAAISEAEMRDIHSAGYFPAIDAGVQTIMASFNSWNGVKMHGAGDLLQGVLKDRMGFHGFVVGDWNGHGQIPGCTNTDCPESLIAGVDMFMAPDSWRGIYDSTLEAVKSGEVPMERLDDAVRRILRVKVVAGIFEKSKPSARAGAGEVSLLGSAEHKEVARRAVRQSLVLLKNNGGVLPLDPRATVLVVGDGADNISKQSGGWTLSWQGGGYENIDFPNGQSILDGIREAVEARGGTVIFDPEGNSDIAADVVIAVYGEDPYAEFQGDRDHLDFEPNGYDTSKLTAYRERGMPVVSVFLSGRPLWVNPELNASDAFVAAWLPGTEGGGVADVLFRTDSSFDFTGQLSFSWPATAADFDNNVGSPGYAPLYPFGFGLTYDDTPAEAPVLSEESGLDPSLFAERGAVFRRGDTIRPWRAYLISENEAVLFNGTTANAVGLSASRTDHLAQEDALRLDLKAEGTGLLFVPEGDAADWSREANGAMELGFAVRTSDPTELVIGMGCDAQGQCSYTRQLTVQGDSNWSDQRLALSCFVGAGVDMSIVDWGIVISAPAGLQLDLADLRLVEDDNGQADCGEPALPVPMKPARK